MVENPHLVRLTAKDLVIETPMTYTHKRVVMSGSGACDPKWPRTDQTRRSDGRKVEALSDVGRTVRQAPEVSRQATSDSSVQLLQQHAPGLYDAESQDHIRPAFVGTKGDLSPKTSHPESSTSRESTSMIGAAKSQSLIVREQSACAHALSESDVESHDLHNSVERVDEKMSPKASTLSTFVTQTAICGKGVTGAAKSRSLVVREQCACAHALSELGVESIDGQFGG